MSLSPRLDVTLVDFDQAEHCLEQRGLASTVWTDDPDEFAFPVGVKVAAGEDVDTGDVASDEIVGDHERVGCRVV